MNAIVVVDQVWAIGREGALLFNLPGDMKRFRELTEGGVVIMGRKTLNSFPEGHPLPNRRNIVITRNTDDMLPEGVEMVSSPADALTLTAGENPDTVWLIGGGSVYAALLSNCQRTYLTKVETVAQGEPDTYFPNLDHLPGWEVESIGEPVTENGLTYRFIQYINRNYTPDE